MKPLESRFVLVTTHSMTLQAFFKNQTCLLQAAGHSVFAMCAANPALDEFAAATGACPIAVDLRREFSLGADVKALLTLVMQFAKLKPRLVHAHTPKAGLLAMIAAWLTRVPSRLYTLHGLPMTTLTGWRGGVLWLADRLACRLATQVLAVSPSLAREISKLGIWPLHRLTVLGDGGCSGVSLSRFRPEPSGASRARIRAQHQIPAHHVVIGFVGRLSADKGFRELMAAWQDLRAQVPDLHLLLCGLNDSRTGLSEGSLRELRDDPQVHLAGFAQDIPDYYAAMDIFVLPTYREGLPTAILEASAMGLPVVAARVTGCVDAVRDGETGLLVPVRESRPLTKALLSLIRNPELRCSLGASGREFIARQYSEEFVTGLIMANYALNLRNTHPAVVSFGKRAFDFVVACALLLLAAPLMLAAALAICMFSPGPILFRQDRGGLHGKVFSVCKFRTMAPQPSGASIILSDSERMTRVGKILRHLSIDELPQLWNILTGDMSLVGPRPLYASYLTRYRGAEARRHEVKPGITGWAQIAGRNSLDWLEKFRRDVWYVDHWSFVLDLQILWKTVRVILFETGTAEITTTEFNPHPAEERAE